MRRWEGEGEDTKVFLALLLNHGRSALSLDKMIRGGREK